MTARFCFILGTISNNMIQKKNKNKKTNRANKPKNKIVKKALKTKRSKSVGFKSALKKSAKSRKVSAKKITKNKKSKIIKCEKKNRYYKKSSSLITLGDSSPSRKKFLVFVILIIFVATGMIFVNIFGNKKQSENISVAPVVVNKSSKLEREIKQMVSGYPIEKMTPYIAKKDPKVAAFLVAIAKKESNWGKRRPVLNGQDCFNYWGFRLKTERMGSGGHTCFDSPQEAVDTVADRIDEMVNEEKIISPNEMIVWKCGYGCKNSEKTNSELKWIKDVSYYYNELGRYL